MYRQRLKTQLPFFEIKKFDLIGYRIVSPLHLVALLAFAIRLNGKKKTKVLVICSNGPWDRSLLDKRQVEELNVDLTFVEEEQIDISSKIWGVYLVCRPLISLVTRIFGRKLVPVCAPSMASLKFVSNSFQSTINFSPVEIEEGIGTYNSWENFKREASLISSYKLIQYLFIYLYRLINFLSPLLVIKSSEFLFKFRGKTIFIDEKIKTSYQRVFAQASCERVARLMTNSIIILTQPLSERKFSDRDSYIRGVKSLCAFATQRGYNPVIKCHPAESANKYRKLGYSVLNHTGPVEEVFAKNCGMIEEVWGGDSTSLIFAQALYGIKARRVSILQIDESKAQFKGKSKLLFEEFTEFLDF